MISLTRLSHNCSTLYKANNHNKTQQTHHPVFQKEFPSKLLISMNKLKSRMTKLLYKSYNKFKNSYFYDKSQSKNLLQSALKPLWSQVWNLKRKPWEWTITTMTLHSFSLCPLKTRTIIIITREYIAVRIRIKAELYHNNKILKWLIKTLFLEI